jgi:5-methyltetrahydrofolate--homocysteine methyltransferase
MIIFGEKLNSSLPDVYPLMEKKDEEAIRSLALKQMKAGASYVCVNAGMFHSAEGDMLEWIIKTIQKNDDVPLMIDSPDPAVLERGLLANRSDKTIIDSITGEAGRYNSIVPLVKKYRTGIVALCMDDKGIPGTAQGRFDVAADIIGRLSADGIPGSDIYIDPVVRPVGLDPEHGPVVFDTVRKLRGGFPDIHISLGLSNASFGLPARNIVNQAFLLFALAAGIDCAICNSLDPGLIAAIYAAEGIQGKDEYCLNFLEKIREFDRSE